MDFCASYYRLVKIWALSPFTTVLCKPMITLVTTPLVATLTFAQQGLVTAQAISRALHRD
jgi:hypothetical protein